MDKVGIAVVPGTIGKGMLHRLGDEMYVGGRIVPEPAKIILAQDVEDLEKDATAGTGWRHGDHLRLAVIAPQREPPLRTVLGEIKFGQHSTGSLYAAREVFGDRAVIESVRTLVRDALQGFRQFRFADGLAGTKRRAIRVQEVAGQDRIGTQAGADVCDLLRQVLLGCKPVAGVTNGRLHHCRQRQGAVTAERLREAGNFSRHRDGQPTV